MTKIALLLIVLSGLLSSTAFAENEAGVVLGTATGFSGAFDLRSNRAFDVGLAYKYDTNTYVYADYLITNARSFSLRGSSEPMTLYYGIGARVDNIKGGKNDGKTAIGPRAPIGLHYNIKNPDISLFGELAMILDVAPESEVEIAAGVGVRIRF
ncbi:MAG: hypothetical protein ACXVAX_13780 [Pseudobdellovibrio sp.]